MNEQATQTEIKAIQERLQAMRAGHQVPRPAPATAAPMVEMFPNRVAPVNLARDTASRTTGSEDSSIRPGYGLAAEWRSPSSTEHDRRSPTVTPDLQHSYPTTYAPQSQMSQPRRAAHTWLVEPTEATDVRTDSRTTEARPTDASSANFRPASVSAASRLQQQEALQQLEAKAQQINQLSAAQEMAMLELKAIATRLERDWSALDLQQTRDGSFGVPLPACEYLATTVPAIERDASGTFVITTRAIDLFQAERDAEVMAQTLRHRTGASTTRRRRAAQPPTSMRVSIRTNRLLQSLWTQLQAIASLVTAQPSAHPTRRPRMNQTYAGGYADEYSQAPVESDTLSYRASALWLGGAIAARIAADLFLASHPAFWLPVVALMVAPAAIAIYRTAMVPQSSVVWGYRLFLVMIGLLLGGRLL